MEAHREARTYSTSLPPHPPLSYLRCAFSDMRRLLEPCWWILFLKITSSVLHYVVCFPGECWPPRGRGPDRRARGCGVVAWARSLSACPGDPERVEGGRAPWEERGSALLVLTAFREGSDWGGWKKGLGGEGDRGRRGLLLLWFGRPWGTRVRRKGGLALLIRRRSGVLELWGC